MLLETIVRLRPFKDYNGIIGATCAWAYSGLAGAPLRPPPGGMVQLVRDIRGERGERLDLGDVARRLREWKA
ncbi:hypothetical protein [Streptomyces sp. NPDC054784]